MGFLLNIIGPFAKHTIPAIKAIIEVAPEIFEKEQERFEDSMDRRIKAEKRELKTKIANASTSKLQSIRTDAKGWLLEEIESELSRRGEL